MNKLLISAAIVAAICFSPVVRAQDENTSAGSIVDQATVSCANTQTVAIAASGNTLAWALENTGGSATVGVYFASQVTTGAALQSATYSNCLYQIAPGGSLTPSIANFSAKPALYKGTVYIIADPAVANATNRVTGLRLRRP